LWTATSGVSCASTNARKAHRLLHSAGATGTHCGKITTCQLGACSARSYGCRTGKHLFLLEACARKSCTVGARREAPLSPRAGATQAPRSTQTVLALLTALAAAAACLAAALCGAQLAAAALRMLAGVVRSFKGTDRLRRVGQLRWTPQPVACRTALSVVAATCVWITNALCVRRQAALVPLNKSRRGDTGCGQAPRLPGVRGDWARCTRHGVPG